MSDMRYTRLEVTVGDYDSGETLREILEQVGRGVRGCGFVTVDVRIADTCADCGGHLVPGIREESGQRRASHGGRYFCRAAADALHHAQADAPAPDLTDVPMVCTSCRKPASAGPPGQWRHDSLDDYLACPGRGRATRVMVAAGNENVPLQ